MDSIKDPYFENFVNLVQEKDNSDFEKWLRWQRIKHRIITYLVFTASATVTWVLLNLEMVISWI